MEHTIREIVQSYEKIVEVQERMNEEYKGMGLSNKDEAFETIRELHHREQFEIRNILSALNRLFNRRWWKFHMGKVGCPKSYKIIPPPFLDKRSTEYILLRKQLYRLHKHYFLCGGGCEYAYGFKEKYIWLVPDKKMDELEDII